MKTISARNRNDCLFKIQIVKIGLASLTMLAFAGVGCSSHIETLPVTELAKELHNPSYRWTGPCSVEDRIPVLYAARELAFIGDEAVPTLLDAMDDTSLDYHSIHDALSEVGLPVELYREELEKRDTQGLRRWWAANRDSSKPGRSEHRLRIGLPSL